MLASLIHSRLAQAASVDGAAEFKARCASCHGESGAGDGPVAPTLRAPLPDLRLLTRRNDGVFPDKVLETIIDGRKTVRAHGNFEMPVWGRDLSRSEGNTAAAERISAIVEYLRSIQTK